MVNVAILDVRDVFVMRTGDPECVKDSTLLPPTPKEFVSAEGSVPHKIRTPVTAVFVEIGHFNATERTPAVATKLPALTGLALTSTIPKPHNLSASASHALFAKGRTDSF